MGWFVQIKRNSMGVATSLGIGKACVYDGWLRLSVLVAVRHWNHGVGLGFSEY